MYFNNYSTGCGCSSNYSYPSPCCSSTYTHNNYNGCGCGCFQVTPVTIPERTNYSHCCHVHEQPVIVPVENRMVHHHTFTPKYYGVSRVTHEDVVEDNPYTTINEAAIYPNFLNM